MKKWLTAIAAIMLLLAFSSIGLAHGGGHGHGRGGGYGYCDGSGPGYCRY